MEEKKKFDNLVAAQFNSEAKELHRLILEVSDKNLSIKDSNTCNNAKIIEADLPLTTWARLYWLFVRPNNKKTWITHKIEESDFYKSLE